MPQPGKASGRTRLSRPAPALFRRRACARGRAGACLAQEFVPGIFVRHRPLFRLNPDNALRKRYVDAFGHEFLDDGEAQIVLYGEDIADVTEEHPDLEVE